MSEERIDDDLWQRACVDYFKSKRATEYDWDVMAEVLWCKAVQGGIPGLDQRITEFARRNNTTHAADTP